MRDDSHTPARRTTVHAEASAYDPYDADRPLMLRCSCEIGRAHV